MSNVKLSFIPKARKVYSYRFPALDGGLNLADAEINLRDNESPEMWNLWYEDGVLQSRPGQSWATAAGIGTGYAVSPEPFWNHTFFHIGASLYRADCRSQTGGVMALSELVSGLPENRGTFVRFGDYLFYKNRGGFYRISYENKAFSVDSMTEIDAFVPTIVINANPETGSGDLYQPENRLSPKKRVTYNATHSPRTVVKTGNGVSRSFPLGVNSSQQLRGLSSVYVNDAYVEPALYTLNLGSGVVIFNAAPPDDSTITFTLNMGTLEYHLPVTGVDSVEVTVDGIPMTAGDDYTVDLASGVVTFVAAPPVTDPPTNNTVEITYSKANPDALNAVMNCPYLTAYGSGVQMCLVAGGCPAQPNAVFWTGSTQYGLDPSYWPVSHYNFVGDTADSVTGFGKQYDQLIVCKARSIGKLDMDFQSVNGRDVISLTYATVNPHIGCDLPYSIQTVENNLVFATTGGGTEGGVYRVQSASAAYENNIVKLSRKVDGSNERPGLLYDLRVAGTGPVFSHDDGKRYWLAVNGHVWLWDYSVSGADSPVWFRFSGFDAPNFFSAHGVTYHLNAAGRVTRLGRTFDDYGGAVRKVYAFPTRNFGSYDALKDVRTVIFSTRKDTPHNTVITYRNDYETRQDRVNLVTEGYDRLAERDLTERDLSVPLTVATFRREPMCRHVRHFSMILENNEAGKDFSLLTAEIQYRFVGRDR